MQLVDTSFVTFDTGSSPLTVPLTQCTAGNLLFIASYNGTGNTLSPVLAGLSPVDQFMAMGNGVVDDIDVWYHVCDGTETGNITLTRTGLKAAMILEVEPPAGWLYQEDLGPDITGATISDGSLTTTASPVTLSFVAGTMVPGQELYGLIQCQVWFARESGAGTSVTFTGDVGGSVSDMSLEVTGLTSSGGTTGWRWRVDLLDLTDPTGDPGLDETMTVTSGASLGPRQASRGWVVDPAFAEEVEAPISQFPPPFEPVSRRINVQALPHQVTSEMWRRMKES